MSPEDKEASLRKRRNRLTTIFGMCFGCVSKKNSHVEKIEKKYASVSCQCEEEKELETNYREEERILVESKAKLDITIYKENEIAPLSEEFKSSLSKLDSLINTLNDIHGIYKKSRSLKYCNEKIQECAYTGEDNFGSGETEEEPLKFNINFDKNTFIQCHTNRGKHSLKIIHSSAQQHFNPLILHRCESEFLLIKKNLLTSSETCPDKSNQLQRSYHTLSSNFGSRILNLTTFKSNLLDHMRNIKEDVRTLRHILFSVEHVIDKKDKSILPFNVGEISKWFLGSNTDIKYGFRDEICLMKQEEYRYIEAKIRATNFCKFHNLGKKLKEKGKDKKHKKKKK